MQKAHNTAVVLTWGYKLLYTSLAELVTFWTYTLGILRGAGVISIQTNHP
jgi:hypothetical protein